jgi:hypothetical protein
MVKTLLERLELSGMLALVPPHQLPRLSPQLLVLCQRKQVLKRPSRKIERHFGRPRSGRMRWSNFGERTYRVVALQLWTRHYVWCSCKSDQREGAECGAPQRRRRQ